jgi:hypothetical protein
MTVQPRPPPAERSTDEITVEVDEALFHILTFT